MQKWVQNTHTFKFYGPVSLAQKLSHKNIGSVSLQDLELDDKAIKLSLLLNANVVVCDVWCHPQKN